MLGTTSRRRSAKGKGSMAAAFIAGAGAGAAGEFFLDPEQGKRRRHILRDKAFSKARRGAAEAERQARYTAGKAQGVAAEATTPGRDPSELNDPALEAKVQSELFRPADVPKGKIDVNVENRVVFLRGEAETEDQIEDLVKRAEAIEGVSSVESLLHLPGAPAPTRS